MGLFDTRAAGLLSAGDLEPAPGFPEDRVDFAQVMGWKLPLLARAADRFLAGARGAAVRRPAGVRGPRQRRCLGRQ